MAKYIPEEDDEDDDPPRELRFPRNNPQPSSSRRRHDDSEDDRPPKESSPRRQRPQRSGSRRGYDENDSDEPPSRDSRADKKKAKAKSSRSDDRRLRYDSVDDDRYGASRRDGGNRARDQSESRSRSRSRNRSRSQSRRRDATALVRHGESSRAASKWDGRSKAVAKKGKGHSRAKHSHSDDEEDEEEVIKIARYIAVDIDELGPDCVDGLCELLEVKVGKVKQWCERELIRKDNTAGSVDLKRLVNAVDEEDAKKLRRFMKKMENENKAAMVHGGHDQHLGRGHSHNDHDFHHVHHYDHHRPQLTPWDTIPGCVHCLVLGRLCKFHLHLAR